MELEDNNIRMNVSSIEAGTHNRRLFPVSLRKICVKESVCTAPHLLGNLNCRARNCLKILYKTPTGYNSDKIYLSFAFKM